MIGFILFIALLLFFLSECLIISSEESRKEEKEKLRQARNDIKVGCIKQSREEAEKRELKAETYENQYKAFYKPARIKKNKLRRKAINAYKNYNKRFKMTISIKDIARDIKYWEKYNIYPKDLDIKAIGRYLKSLNK